LGSSGVVLFRIFGVLAGFYVFGFLGALLGYFLGSIIDRFRAFGAIGMNPFSAPRRQSVFLETVFMSMGKLAKVDGRISENEIAHVEQFILKLGMSSEHRLNAIVLFKRGASSKFDINPKLNEFIAICGYSSSLKQMLLVYLIIMGLSDGQLNTAEVNLLRNIGKRLGYSKAAFEQLLDMVLNQTHFAEGQAMSADALEDAYKALGVTQNSSDKEIKSAYRKLMSQYHPDKLMGQGVPEEMISVATEQAKEVQIAYDLIKKHREQNQAAA
jgi:DnaJ like chaperone protein